MINRAAGIESLWFFDFWWRLNWHDVDASYFKGEPEKRAWSA